LVEQILASTVGGAYQPQEAKRSRCALHRPHARGGASGIRDGLFEGKRLLSISPRCAFIEWRTPNGCASCRPAINYI